MLKGLIIQASHTEALEAALTASGLPWRKVPGGSGKAISKASGSLGEPKELLCLVETDAEEKAALEQGFFCIGYLNTSAISFVFPFLIPAAGSCWRALRKLIENFWSRYIREPWGFRSPSRKQHVCGFGK